MKINRHRERSLLASLGPLGWLAFVPVSDRDRAIAVSAAEDEARTAIEQGTPRHDLTMAAQMAYDRLTQEDPR
jgi:hypothetical protein